LGSQNRINVARATILALRALTLAEEVASERGAQVPSTEASDATE